MPLNLEKGAFAKKKRWQKLLDRFNSPAQVQDEVLQHHAKAKRHIIQFGKVKIEVTGLRYASDKHGALIKGKSLFNPRQPKAVYAYALDVPRAPRAKRRDPWREWIDTHRGELAQYAGSTIAIHPIEGVVVHAEDALEFAEKYNAYLQKHPGAGKQLLVSSGSMYTSDE